MAEAAQPLQRRGHRRRRHRHPHRPERLILGLPDPDGTLVVAGGTGPLNLGQLREVAAFLEPCGGDHPWPEDIPAGRVGAWAGKRRLPTTRVEPTLVVEVDADAAYEYGHFRHLTRLIRTRPDLTPAEVSSG